MADPQRVLSLLSDPKVTPVDRRRALELIPGIDTSLRDRAAALLDDPRVEPADRQRMLDILGKRMTAPPPIGGTKGLQDLQGLPGRTLRAGVEFAKEQGPEIAGGTIGGGIGSALGAATGPLAPVATPVLGGLGAGLGTTAADMAQRYFQGEEQPTVSERRVETAMGAFPEMVSQGAMRIANKLFGRSAHMAAGDIANREAAERMGVEFMPADVNPATASWQGDLARLRTSSNVIREGIERRGVQTAAAGERTLVGGFGGRLEPSQVGEEVAMVGRPTLDNLKRRGSEMFRSASAVADARGLHTQISPDVVDSAQQLLGEIDPAMPEAGQARVRAVLEQLRRRASPAGGSYPARAAQPDVPLSELLGYKSQLNELLPEHDARGFATSFTGGALERLHGQLEGDILRAARGDPMVSASYVRAKNFWEDEVVPLRKWVEKATPKSDDELLDFYVHANRPDRLQILFRNIEQRPEGQGAANTLRAGWFGRAIDESTTDPRTGALDPAKFISRWQRMGPEVQQLLSGGRPEVGEFLNMVAGQARGAELGANPPQTARALMGFGQVGLMAKGAMDALTAGSPGGAAQELGGTIALGALPYGAAQAMTSTLGRNFLTGGMAAPPGGPTATRALMQALLQSGVKLDPAMMERVFGPMTPAGGAP